MRSNKLTLYFNKSICKDSFVFKGGLIYQNGFVYLRRGLNPFLYDTLSEVYHRGYKIVCIKQWRDLGNLVSEIETLLQTNKILKGYMAKDLTEELFRFTEIFHCVKPL